MSVVIHVIRTFRICTQFHYYTFQISDKLPKVKWAQGTWAGVEAFLRNPEKVRDQMLNQMKII